MAGKICINLNFICLFKNYVMRVSQKTRQREEGGVWEDPKMNDVINEQPLFLI